MAETINIKVNFDDGGSLKTMNSLEGKLDNLKESIGGVDIGSEEFRKLAGEISKTESELKNLDLSMEGLDMEQKSSEFGSMAAGMADVATGAYALSNALGITNESSEEMMETLVSGMAVAQSFSGGIDGIISMQKLLRTSTIASTTATNANTVATKASTTATKGGTVAMRVFNAVTKANPVMLLVGAITAAVGAFALFSSSTKEAKDDTNDFAEAQERLNNALDFQLSRYRQIFNIQQRGRDLKSTQKRLELENKMLRVQDKITDLRRNEPENIETLIKYQKQLNWLEEEAQRVNAEAQREKLEKEQSFRKAAIVSINERIKKNKELRIDTINNMKLSSEEEKKQLAKIDESTEKLKKELENVKQQQQNEALETAALTQKLANDEKKLRIKNANEIADLRAKLSGEAKEDVEEVKEELAEIQDYVDMGDAPELPQYNPFEIPEGELTPIQQAQNTADELLRIQKENLDNKYINEKQYADRVKEINEWLAGEEKKIVKAKAMFAIDQTGMMFSQMAAFAEEGSGAQKTFALASIIADTASSMMKAVPVALEASKATGPGAPFVFAGTLAGIVGTVVAAAANAKKVLSTSPGPSGGGGGNVTRPRLSTQDSITQTPDVNLFGQGTGGSQGDATMFDAQGSTPQPIQAYVQWSDIDNVQQQDAVIQNQMQL